MGEGRWRGGGKEGWEEVQWGFVSTGDGCIARWVVWRDVYWILPG